jgi:RsiW-degrading membrane proteinase PrsW (M82 family)
MGAMIGLALLLSYLPMVGYALFIWWLDRYEKEPLRLASTAFLWGTLPAILIARMAEAALELPLEEGLERDLISSGLIAPLAEETAKGLFLALLFLRRRDEIDSLYDGFLYGSLVGFGFAATENVFYLIGAGIEGGTAAMLALASLRAGIFGLNHAFFTGFTGLGLAMARLSPRGFRRLWAPLVGWSAGVGFHAFHNGVLTLVSHLGDEGSVPGGLPHSYSRRLDGGAVGVRPGAMGAVSRTSLDHMVSWEGGRTRNLASSGLSGVSLSVAAGVPAVGRSVARRLAGMETIKGSIWSGHRAGLPSASAARVGGTTLGEGNRTPSGEDPSPDRSFKDGGSIKTKGPVFNRPFCFSLALTYKRKRKWKG